MNARFRLPSIAIAAATLFAAPAAAQGYSVNGFAKGEAILGGQSRLAAVLLQQASAAPTAALLAGSASSPLVPAVLRNEIPVREPVSTDQPDVFGSVALRIGHSPLDGRWARVASAKVGGTAGLFATALQDEAEVDRLESINAYVNAHVRFVDDWADDGSADRWSAAGETLSRGRGDCEDYALAKLAMARRAGFADKDLYLVVLKDLVRRADHAVLVVRSEGRFLVLDNGTDRIVDSDQVRDYRPVLTFTQGKVFTHGYRRTPSSWPPVIMASSRIEMSPARATYASYTLAENRPLPVSMFAAPSPSAGAR